MFYDLILTFLIFFDIYRFCIINLIVTFFPNEERKTVFEHRNVRLKGSKG